MTVLMDEEKHLDPQNPIAPGRKTRDRRYEGPVTIRHALRHSLNTTAVEVYTELLTPSISLSYLKRMGIDRSTNPSRREPSGLLVKA